MSTALTFLGGALVGLLFGATVVLTTTRGDVLLIATVSGGLIGGGLAVAFGWRFWERLGVWGGWWPWP